MVPVPPLATPVIASNGSRFLGEMKHKEKRLIVLLHEAIDHTDPVQDTRISETFRLLFSQ